MSYFLFYSYLFNNKKITSLDFCKFLIKKIENSFYKNYFINIDKNFIFSQCKYSDIILKLKKNNVLTGIPVVHKDIFNIKNLKTTAGSRILKKYKSPYNSTFINKIKNLGMINFGKLNMDEFCIGSDNFNFYNGFVSNNSNGFISPGGSSGACASIVSAGFFPISTGSDTGGSIRQPALLNGVLGFKPTYGTISKHGMIPYCSSLDTIGLTSKNIIDTSIFLNSISGFDIKDPTSFNYLKEDFTRYLNKSWLLKKSFLFKKVFLGMKIGISKNLFSNIFSFKIRSNIENILSFFEILGSNILFLDIFFFDFISSVYFVISSSELYSNLSRYNKYLYNSDYFFNEVYFYFSNIIKSKLFLGNYLLFLNKKKKYFFYSKKFRRLIFQNFKNIFLICDVVLLPILPLDNWYIFKNFNNIKILIDYYTSASNLTGLPSASIPTGFFLKNNIKIYTGFQIISNYFKDARIIQIVHEFKKFFFN